MIEGQTAVELVRYVTEAYKEELRNAIVPNNPAKAHVDELERVVRSHLDGLANEIVKKLQDHEYGDRRVQVADYLHPLDSFTWPQQ